MIRSTTRAMALFAVLAAILIANSCSKTEQASFTPPTYYSEETTTQARDYITQGYELLDSDLVDSAETLFAQLTTLIPNGLVGEYHMACSRSRAGDADGAFLWLDKMLAAGYDSPDGLKYDQDFESLNEDPRFEALLAKAAQNAEIRGQALADGIPEYDTPPQLFTSTDDLETWLNEQNQELRRQSRYWAATDYTLAQIDLIGKKLAALRVLNADSAQFDYGLERIREACGLGSWYEPWGAVADLVLRETKDYLAGNRTDAGVSEANYRAGWALTMKYDPKGDQRVAAWNEADTYLSKVAEGTEMYAALTMSVVNKLRLPEANEAQLAPALKALVEANPEDSKVYRIVSTQFGAEYVRLTWPVPVDLTDIDGKPVSLASYKGKVLLLDFWATWCGPCRVELPGLVETYKRYHGQGFEIVSISLDYENRVPLPDYRVWIAEHEMTWRHTYDGKGWNTPKVKDYFVSGIPAPFLVGPDGSLFAYGDDCQGEKLPATVERAIATTGK